MKSRYPLAWVLGFVAFVMNPAFACSSSSSSQEDQFEFGEAEMFAAVGGHWRVTFARPEGPSSVTISVEQGPAANGQLAAPGRTPQCGSRTFTRPAAACITVSSLTLAATILEADPPLEATAGKGSLMVSGMTFTSGRLSLDFDANFRLNADIASDGSVQSNQVLWQGTSVTSVLERETN